MLLELWKGSGEAQTRSSIEAEDGLAIHSQGGCGLSLAESGRCSSSVMPVTSNCLKGTAGMMVMTPRVVVEGQAGLNRPPC